MATLRQPGGICSAVNLDRDCLGEDVIVDVADCAPRQLNGDVGTRVVTGGEDLFTATAASAYRNQSSSCVCPRIRDFI